MTKVRGKNNLGISFYFSPHSFIVIEKKKTQNNHKTKKSTKKETRKISTQRSKILQILKTATQSFFGENKVKITLNLLDFCDTQNFCWLHKYLIFNCVAGPLYICDFKLGCIFRIFLMLEVAHVLG